MDNNEHNDYSKWTQREINHAIMRRVFGYEFLPPPATPSWQRPTERGVECMYSVPHFSIDMDSAWQIVKELVREPIAFTLETVNLTNGKSVVEALFWNDKDKFGSRRASNEEGLNNPAMAICIAALRFLDQISENG